MIFSHCDFGNPNFEFPYYDPSRFDQEPECELIDDYSSSFSFGPQAHYSTSNFTPMDINAAEFLP